jgi:hypothetical protein
VTVAATSVKVKKSGFVKKKKPEVLFPELPAKAIRKEGTLLADRTFWLAQ